MGQRQGKSELMTQSACFLRSSIQHCPGFATSILHSNSRSELRPVHLVRPYSFQHRGPCCARSFRSIWLGRQGKRSSVSRCARTSLPPLAGNLHPCRPSCRPLWLSTGIPCSPRSPRKPARSPPHHSTLPVVAAATSVQGWRYSEPPGRYLWYGRRGLQCKCQKSPCHFPWGEWGAQPDLSMDSTRLEGEVKEPLC
jgi:hypothetical protein